MVLTCSRNGLLAAWRRPGLAILLWAWSVLLALPLTLPAWTWLQGGTARTPDADLLLDRFSFAVMGDLLRADPSLNLLVPAFLATALVAVVGQALTGGGLIEVLTSDDARSFLHRFFRGAGHFFWRFLRAGIYAWLLFGIASVIVTVAFGPVSRALEEMDWEPARYLGLAVRLLILALLALFVTLAFDYARIRMAREDSRRALRAFFGSLWFVARHPRATFGVWLVLAVALAVVYAAYGAYRTYVPSNTWVLILLMVVVQQVTLLVAAGVRVALVAGEIGVWDRIGEGSTFAPEIPHQTADHSQQPTQEREISPPPQV
jgi:hypothetical protein